MTGCAVAIDERNHAAANGGMTKTEMRADALKDSMFYGKDRINACQAITAFYIERLDSLKVDKFIGRMVAAISEDADESHADVVDDYINDFFFNNTNEEDLDELEQLL